MTLKLSHNFFLAENRATKLGPCLGGWIHSDSHHPVANLPVIPPETREDSCEKDYLFIGHMFDKMFGDTIEDGCHTPF